MRREKYDSFDQWHEDMERVNDSPNDSHLLQHVIRCVENSSDEIKAQVKEYLVGRALETNPWFVFDQVAKASPNHSLFVKSRNDPWFQA